MTTDDTPAGADDPKPVLAATPAQSERYTEVAIALHWSTAALVLSTIPLGLFGASDDGGLAQSATNLHKGIGILILALTLARLGWRITHRPPPLSDSYAVHLRWMARVAHVLFYVLLIAMPLSGWWMSSAVPVERHPIGIGPLHFPFLPVERGWPSAGPARQLHGNLAWLMIALVVLHIAAALRHQLIDKDNVISRMLPRRA